MTTTQYYTGINEIADIYDYPGAELEDLIQSGTQRLQELMNENKFEITIDSETELAIGDIVGGRDYLSGMTMQAPITGKVVKWESGFETIEYILEDDVTVNVSAPIEAKSIKLMRKSEELTK